MSDNWIGHYLTPDWNTFWDWNAAGEAVVWWNDQTLALYEELDLLLREMRPRGLPRFEELLLVLAATRRTWSEAEGQASFFLGKIDDLDPQGWKDFPIFQWLKPLLNGLNGVQKVARRAGYGAEVSRSLVAHVFANAGDALDEKEAGELEAAFGKGEVSLWAQRRDRVRHGSSRNPPLALLQTVRNLVELLEDFDSEMDLELLMRTGLSTTIKPADFEELPFTERLKGLLLQLEEERSELSGVARVARQLGAVINLPRRLNDPLDQPVGGYSDVCNRGAIDRLLVSELAQDPDVLAMRVALNEALYLRRESPPDEPTSERHIFVDTGVRMWGMPRVYAIGVTLAFAVENHTGREALVFTGEADEPAPAQIDSREGITQLMGSLSPDPHPGSPVSVFFAEANSVDGGADCVLVTTEKVWSDKRFRQAIGSRRPEEFLVALVDRDGWLRLLQVTAAGERELKRLRLDLDEILDRPIRGRSSQLLDGDEALPKFLRLRESPLRFGGQIGAERAHFHHEAGLLSHTADGLLLLRKRVDMGALLLTTKFPKGRPFWTQIDQEQREGLFLFDRGGRVLLYRVGLDTGEAVETEIIIVEKPRFVHRIGEVLLFFSGRNVFAYQMSNGRCVGRTTLAGECRQVTDHFARIGEQWFAMRLNSLESGKVSQYKNVPLNAEATEVLQFERAPASDALYIWSHPHWPEPLIVNEGMSVSCLNEPGDVVAGRGNVDGEVLGVSSDRDRLFVRHDNGDWSPAYALDVRNNTFKRLYGQLNVFDLEPEAFRLQCAVPQLRKNFTGVFLSPPCGLHLLTRKQRLLTLGIEGTRVKRIFWREGPLTQHMIEQGWTQPVDWLRREDDGNEQVTSARFEDCQLQVPGRFTLTVAEFLDGSRIFLDRRGLLHLKSSNPQIPEVTIVLKDGEASGWCSNGDHFGNVYFIGKHKSRAAYVYPHVEQFVAYILRQREQGMVAVNQQETREGRF